MHFEHALDDVCDVLGLKLRRVGSYHSKFIMTTCYLNTDHRGLHRAMEQLEACRLAQLAQSLRTAAQNHHYVLNGNEENFLGPSQRGG